MGRWSFQIMSRRALWRFATLGLLPISRMKKGSPYPTNMSIYKAHDFDFHPLYRLPLETLPASSLIWREVD